MNRFRLTLGCIVVTVIPLISSSCAAAGRLTNTAGRAAEAAAGQEVAGRVYSGVNTGADALEDAVLGGDTETPLPGTASASPAGPAGPPGEGAWSNYDFVPGEEILFVEDFSADNVGDFPRRLEFLKGGMEIVDWEGQRFLRVTSNDSRFFVELLESLPQRFTIELDAHVGHPNAPIVVSTFEPDSRRGWQSAESRPYFFFDGAAGHSSGIHQAGQSVAAAEDLRIGREVVTLRIMADGSHVKVYMNERRLANHPQLELERTQRVYFSFPDVWADRPILLSNLRIASGGADLYDKLAEEGRVVTHGILFDVNSDHIKPESTPTLTEIGTMLQEHGALRLSIEGHTDSSGSADYNLELSQRRADAVRAYLVSEFGIDQGRLEAAGKGESTPADTNGTPEGQQNNRRVELVKIG